MAQTGKSGDVLTAAQQKAVQALLTAPSIAAAAKSAGVAERTLHRWLRENAHFRDALAQAEGQVIGAVTRRLVGYADHALTVMVTVMADKTNSPATRLRAAQAILDSMLRLRELRNLEERISALEAAHAQQHA